MPGLYAGAVVCGSVTLVLIAVVPSLLLLFFGEEFTPAVAATRVLLVAALFASLRRILIDGARGLGKPVWGTIAECVTLIALPVVIAVIPV